MNKRSNNSTQLTLLSLKDFQLSKGYTEVITYFKKLNTKYSYILSESSQAEKNGINYALYFLGEPNYLVSMRELKFKNLDVVVVPSLIPSQI